MFAYTASNRDRQAAPSLPCARNVLRRRVFEHCTVDDWWACTGGVFANKREEFVQVAPFRTSRIPCTTHDRGTSRYDGRLTGARNLLLVVLTLDGVRRRRLFEHPLQHVLHLIIKMIKSIRTSRLSIKNSLSLRRRRVFEHPEQHVLHTPSSVYCQGAVRWIRTSRLSIKNSLYLCAGGAFSNIPNSMYYTAIFLSGEWGQVCVCLHPTYTL